MRTEWFVKAEEQKDSIANYIFERFGFNRMEQFLNEVEMTIGLIGEYPNIGAIDPLFEKKKNHLSEHDNRWPKQNGLPN